MLGDQTICNVDFDHEEASHDACAGLISSSLQADAGFASGFSSGFEHWLHGLGCTAAAVSFWFGQQRLAARLAAQEG